MLALLQPFWGGELCDPLRDTISKAKPTLIQMPIKFKITSWFPLMTLLESSRAIYENLQNVGPGVFLWLSINARIIFFIISNIQN